MHKSTGWSLNYFVLYVQGLMFFLFLVGCGPPANQYAPPPPPKVTVAKPLMQNVIDYAYFTGITRAVEKVDIRAQVSGVLESIDFRPGHKVKRGQLLFVIDPRTYKAALDQAKATLAIRQAELELAEATLSRKSRAYKDRAVSEVEVLEARAKRDQARAAIAAANAEIDSAEVTLSYTHITSPIDGWAGRNTIDVGNLVDAGGKTLLTTVVKDDPIQVYFHLPETALLEIISQIEAKEQTRRPADEVRYPLFMQLANESGFPHSGYIDYVDNRVDPETGTIKIRGVFPNPNAKIFDGLFARVRLPQGELKDALLVPEAVVGADQRGRYLFLVNAENVVEQRVVEMGPAMNGLQVIIKGLGPGDRVVINGLQRARHGAKVTPVESQIEKTSTGSRAG